MAELKIPVLTIGIPTYNRVAFLKRNLDHLYAQIEGFEDIVEIIVSDNASTDSTNDVVRDFITKGFKINYIKNPENKGADFNIAQCYTKANGNYVLVLGDDDFLRKNALKNIINVIRANENAGIIFLNGMGFENEPSELAFDEATLDYKVYNNQKSFLHYITYYVTFISGNIVNRKTLKYVNLSPWMDSCLVQVPLILTAIKMFETNIVIKSKLLAVQIENTGGYNIYKVFGKTLNLMVNEVFAGQYISYRKIIINDLFVRFFPPWIKRGQSESKFLNIKPEEIKGLLNYNFYYWLIIHPLLFLPKKVSILYFYIIRIYSGLRRRALLMINS